MLNEPVSQSVLLLQGIEPVADLGLAEILGLAVCSLNSIDWTKLDGPD
jgi:hypothetical protein